MKLLIDTDAFCKLGVAGLLPDVVSRVFGTVISECGRLPALPHMLQRGVLRDRYGGAVCDELIPAARSMPVLPDASIAWLEKLTPIDEIDPGEVQLLACAADSDLFVLTGDKRALRALRNAGDIVDLLKGRVVTLEAVFIALYDKLGPEEVRRRIAPLTKLDNVVSICFSAENPNPRECLVSYFNALADEVEPFDLWDPGLRGAK